MKKFICIYILVVCCLFMGAPAFATVPDYLSIYKTEYEIYDLGLIPDGSTSVAYSINNNMTVAGDAANGTGMQHAFIYTNNQMSLIGDTTYYSKASAINDAGQVVGYRDNGSGEAEAYIYQNGKYETFDLKGTSSYAYGLNNWGQVVGNYKTNSGDSHAFLYDGIDVQDLGTLGGNFSIAKDISILGGVVGYSTTDQGNDHAFVYSAGTGQMTDIGTLGGNNSYGSAINRFGNAVGYSDTESGDSHAFYYDGEEMTDMGTLGGENSYANNISEMGFSVGYSETADGEYHAFVYHEKAFWYEGVTMIDLNDFIAEDSEWDCITNAYDINEWGQIVGVGTIDGTMHAFLMNPLGVDYGFSEVPLPGTSLLFGSCIALYGISRRRRV